MNFHTELKTHMRVKSTEPGGYIRFNEGKHQYGHLGVKVIVNYAERERIKVSVVDY